MRREEEDRGQIFAMLRIGLGGDLFLADPDQPHYPDQEASLERQASVGSKPVAAIYGLAKRAVWPTLDGADGGLTRKVFLGYRHDSFQIGRSVRYFSRARIKFQISPGQVSNGSEIRMRGRLPGPRAGGRVAIVEAAALHSRKWYPFGEGTTNRHGVFHIRYRFDNTPVTTVYKIRARAPRQHEWPWEGGRSKPVFVEVRG